MVAPLCVPVAVRASYPDTGYCTHAKVAEAAVAVEALAAAVEPIAGQSGCYPDAFAAWSHAGGVLVARIRDAGPDAAGRPHTRRIEAGWFAEPPTDAVLAGLLNAAAWPDAVPDDAVSITLTPSKPFVSGPLKLPTFIGDSTVWHFRGLHRASEPSSSQPEQAKLQKSWIHIRLVVLPLLAAVSAGAGVWLMKVEPMKLDIDAAEAHRTDIEKERDEARHQTQTARQALIERERQDPLASLSADVRNMKSTSIEILNRIMNIEKQLTSIQQIQAEIRRSLDGAQKKTEPRFTPKSGPP